MKTQHIAILAAGIALAAVLLGTAARPAFGATTPAAGGWSQVTVGAPGPSAGLSGVACPTASLCYAVGARDLSTPAAFKSTDGGHSWTGLAISGSSTLNAIACPSATLCVATGNAGVLERTTDGGATWSLRPNDATTSLTPIGPVACPSTSACIALAGKLALVSADGGQTWRTQTVTAAQGALLGLSCPTITTCYAVGVGYTVVKTTDGGTSWTAQTPPAGLLRYGLGRYTSVSCPTVTSCMAVGGESGTGRIAATTDGGQTWTAQTVENAAPPALMSVSCPAAGYCYAGGTGVILSTVDGGTRWATQPYPGSGNGESDINGIACTPAGPCVMVGATLNGSTFTTFALVNEDASGSAAGHAPHGPPPHVSTICEAGAPPAARATGPGHLYFERDHQIYAAFGDGSGAHPLTADGSASAPDQFPAVSPDGRLVAYARAGHIYVVAAAGGTPRSVGQWMAANEPAFSPNGRCLTFYGYGGYQANGDANLPDLLTVVVATGRFAPDYSNLLGGLFPAWSPDGRTFAASVADGNGLAIDAVDVPAATLALFNHQTYHSTMLIGDGVHDFLFPQFSRDGGYIVCVRTAGASATSGDLWITRSTGPGGGVLVQHVGVGRVAFSPDESAVALQYKGDIWVYRFSHRSLAVLVRNARDVAWGV